MKLPAIEEQALRLSEEEKERLILRLQKSLKSSTEEPPDWHGDILAERQRMIDSGEAKYIPWEEVKAEMREWRTQK